MGVSVLYHRYWLPKYEKLPDDVSNEATEDASRGAQLWAGISSHKRQPSHDLPGVNTPRQSSLEGSANAGQQGSGHGRMGTATTFNVECGL